MDSERFWMGREGKGPTAADEVVIALPDPPNEDDFALEALENEGGFSMPDDSGNPKDLIAAAKPDLSLVPAAGILYEAQAMMDGAKKYGPYNWREKKVKYRVYIAAAQRHLAQLLDREDFDPISGVHHIGHARACLGIAADAIETGNMIDDRPLSGPASDMIRRFGDSGSFKS